MRLTFLVTPLLLAACATVPAVSSGVKIDPTTRPSCEANCAQMGLTLSAVVLVRNSAGCVCAVPEAKQGVGMTRGAPTGAVAVAEAARIADDETDRSQSMAMQEQRAPPPAPPAQ